VVSNVEPNHLYEIREKGSKPGVKPASSEKRKTWFTDVSDLINDPQIAANVTKCLRATSAGGNSGPAFTFTNVGGIGGPWNCVATGDFDKDGQVDLVGGNWGRNTKYQQYLKRPIHVFQGDIDGDGKDETIDAFEEPETGKLRPWQRLDAMGRMTPWVLQRFPTYAAYSVADMDDILGELKPKLKHMTVTSLDSMVFLKRGDRYEPRTLPIEAQFAPVLAICVADFDDDGNKDVFLAQNFFGTDPDTSCYDAGQGVLLRGDGRGNFKALSSLESGIAIYGEQRGCAACDFDGDDRTDLVVTQHGAATKLYKNQASARKK
jgi:enediyne biosynthesis protein E4